MLILADIQSNINSIVAGTTLVSVLGIVWWIGRYTERVNIMWLAFLQNGLVKAVNTGLAEVRSPARLINGSGQILSELKDALHDLYEKNKTKSESELALLIQRDFGAQLATEVWIPNNIDLNTGLMIAVAVAKGTETLTEILDHTLPVLQKNEQVEVR